MTSKTGSKTGRIRSTLVLGLLGLAACENGASPSSSSDASRDGTGGVTAGTGGHTVSASGGSGPEPGSGGGPATGGSGGQAGVDGTGGVVGTGGLLGTGGKFGTGGSALPGSGGADVAPGGAGGRATSVGGTKAGNGGADGAVGGRPDSGGGRGGKGGGAGSAGAGGTAVVVTGSGPPETKPVGYGQGTTGGGSVAAVEANSMAAVQAAIDAYSGSGGLTIRYTGKFNFASITDPCTQWKLPGQIVEIKKKSDITLLGADGSAANFGIHIGSSSSNIIIRNMTFGLLPGGDAADAISLEGMSGGFPTNVWIDHNELFSSMAECAGAGDSSFDGLIDMKKGADQVTVSYNYLHDHHKVSLNGYSDSDTAVRHVTFHHNIFENVGSRTPLQRGGYSHLLNNVFDGVETSGVNVRMDGHALIEGNFFSNVKNPITSRDSSALGTWEIRGSNNITTPADFATFGITWVASSSTPTADATTWTTTGTYPSALGYSYAVDPAACVRNGLPKVAGAGKGLATLKCK